MRGGGGESLLSWSETPSRSLCTGFIHHHSPITDRPRPPADGNTAVRPAEPPLLPLARHRGRRVRLRPRDRQLTLRGGKEDIGQEGAE